MTTANVVLAVHGDSTAPVETAICLSLLDYVGFPSCLTLTLIPDCSSSKGSVFIPLPKAASNFSSVELLTSLPTVIIDDISSVAGLSAVLRQILKQSGSDWSHLLGFRGSCLAAPAEFSQWTRFCEVDAVQCAVESLFQPTYLPKALASLESHLSCPAKVHNVSKYGGGHIPHDYVEGPHLVLADLVIAVCAHITLSAFCCQEGHPSLPLVTAWLRRVKEEGRFKNCLDKIKVTPMHEKLELSPVLTSSSLYRTEKKKKAFTQQTEVDTSLLQVSCVHQMAYCEPMGSDIQIDSNDIYFPDVPEKRRDRKLQQLLNLTKAALQVVQSGDTVVDFCSGSGHLGLMVAALRRDTEVILLDNKEKSLERARTQVSKGRFENVTIVQANIDYFIGQFQVGMALHACGVATDLVLQKCLYQRASIILCPCCYGGIQVNHSVGYPLSRAYRSAGLTERGLIVLGHCADTEDSEEGKKAMQAVDTDRCLFLSEQGYSPSLSKLIPPECTTRNNLIVAKPI